MAEKLFDQSILNKLNRLNLIASRVRAGVLKGERRSSKRGSSMEFADYRNYARGDDLRRVDWNVYARLDRPFVKLFEEEEDLSVHVLIDASASMDFPRGPDLTREEHDQHKFRFAQRVGAALGYITLGSGDYLSLTGLIRTTENLTWGPHRGRGRALELIRFVEEMPVGTTLNLDAALHQYAVRNTRPGLLILISDLLNPNGFQDGLAALQNVGHEIALIHILSPEEVKPSLLGDLQLIDVETGASQDVTVDAAMREMYIRRLLQWRDDNAAFCLRRGIHYATVETSTTWDNLILYELRRLGVVR